VSTLAILEELEEKGFAIVPAVLRPEIVGDLTGCIEDAMRSRSESSSYAVRNLLEAVPVVREVAESGAVRALVEPALGPRAFIARSLLFDKTPDANWKVAWHQDVTIAVRDKIEVPGFSAWSVKDGVAHVQPPAGILERMLTVRLHLDDCGEVNGPLQVMPGSHRSGRMNAVQISEWRGRETAAICNVPCGGALLVRPLLLHASSAAREPGRRRVIHLEFAAESLPGGLQWHCDSRSMRHVSAARPN